MNWLLVPLDDRPCCYRFPQQLAPIDLPPREWLGRFQRPGEPDRLLDWLAARAGEAPGSVLSLDMLAWGGLVASRHPGHSLDSAREHLERLRQIPGRKLAFQTILRNAPTQTNAEEMRWAEALVRLSESLGQDAGLREQIPEPVLEAYLQVRRRNATLYDLSGRLGLDVLLYALDDSRTRGWNLEELRALGPVQSLPGTDETALLLLCRALCPGKVVQSVWSHPGLKSFQGTYEDRPAEALLQSHLDAADLRAGESSLQLWLFGRGGEPQLEAREQTAGSIDAAWLDSLERAVDAGTRVVLVDLSFANGGDLSLGRALLERNLWSRLHGYAAWNTMGNRVGTALANLVLPCPDSTGFLLERIADDLLYQADFRWRAAARLGHPGLTLTAQEERIVERDVFPSLREELEPYARQLGRSANLALRLPWSRLFEVEIG